MDNKMDIKIIIKICKYLHAYANPLFKTLSSSKFHRRSTRNIGNVWRSRNCAQLFVFMRKRDLFTAKYVYCLASILLKHGEYV